MGDYCRPLQTVHSKYAEKTKTAVVTPTSGNNLVFVGATVNNRSGGAAILGVGFKIINGRWLAGQWDDSAGASYTDDTTDAQDAGTDDFPLFTTTDDDGFVVQSLDKFGIIGITVTTAEAGTPTYVVEYWNGTAWADLLTIEEPADYTAAEHAIVFSPPVDWTALAAGDTPVDTDGLTAGYYAIKVDASTAPTTAPIASDLWVAKLYDYKEAVADNAVLNVIPEDSRGYPLQAGEQLIPYFGTAGTSNSVTFRYRETG